MFHYVDCSLNFGRDREQKVYLVIHITYNSKTQRCDYNFKNNFAIFKTYKRKNDKLQFI